MRFIFDLDMTTVDSSHRQHFVNGKLDLPRWKRDSTPANIMRDSLLPLARHWRSAWKSGAEIVVCTAREMTPADYEFLRAHGLHYDAILSRPAGDSSADGALKERLIRQYAQTKPETWERFCRFTVMFDDSQNVIKTLAPLGVRMVESTHINERLAA